jgi:DNA polymerase III subunit epsilon
MREIVLDTETTGLSPSEGHRIVEIGAVELINHIPSGEVFHTYINPERQMPKEAEAVHGLSDAKLKGEPIFKSIAEKFLAFIGDAPLVIHNADFDMEFLNAELSYLKLPHLPPERAIDTVKMSRKKFPMASASLDALCKRFGIDTSKRVKHGALVDAELLADVYLELIGGRQTALILAGPGAGSGILARSGQNAAQHKSTTPGSGTAQQARQRPSPLAQRLTAIEREQHQALVTKLGNAGLWPRSGQ